MGIPVDFAAHNPLNLCRNYFGYCVEIIEVRVLRGLVLARGGHEVFFFPAAWGTGEGS